MENIFVKSWNGCHHAALRAYSGDDVVPVHVAKALETQEDDEALLALGHVEDEVRRGRRLTLEGRADSFRVTNETYRWVSDARFHPDGKKVGFGRLFLHQVYRTHPSSKGYCNEMVHFRKVTRCWRRMGV